MRSRPGSTPNGLLVSVPAYSRFPDGLVGVSTRQQIPVASSSSPGGTGSASSVGQARIPLGATELGPSETETRPTYYCNHAENQRESDYQSETIRAGRRIIVGWIMQWRSVGHQILPTWNSWHASESNAQVCRTTLKDGQWLTRASKRTQIPLLLRKNTLFSL
jgi:hypothetical protein